MNCCAPPCLVPFGDGRYSPLPRNILYVAWGGGTAGRTKGHVSDRMAAERDVGSRARNKFVGTERRRHSVAVAASLSVALTVPLALGLSTPVAAAPRRPARTIRHCLPRPGWRR